MQQHKWLILASITSAIFIALTSLAQLSPPKVRAAVQDRVVISAPIQLVLTGGDRYLSANIEVIRSAVSGPTTNTNDMLYRIRSHYVAAQLNPCHEDNLYLGNALLSWGGAVVEGTDILRRETECRSWDEMPPFFYGFNLYYFYKNSAEASRAFSIAASRSVKNYALFKKASIMITSNQLDSETVAIDFLRQERNKNSDPSLKQMLDKRIHRLEGLLILRNAQIRFEAQYKRPLTSPQELIDSNILSSLPVDPLGLGYSFLNGSFALRNLQITGTE